MPLDSDAAWGAAVAAMAGEVDVIIISRFEAAGEPQAPKDGGGLVGGYRSGGEALQEPDLVGV